MTEQHVSHLPPAPPDDRPGSAPRPERGGRWSGAARRWWAAAVFVVGLVVGGLVVGVLVDGSPATVRVAGVAPGGPAGAPGAPAQLRPGTDQVVVNRACLRSLNAAQDVVDAVDSLGSAASELNAAQLDEIVRRLEPLQSRLQQGLDDCAVVGVPPSGSSPSSGSPAVTAGTPGTTTPTD